MNKYSFENNALHSINNQFLKIMRLTIVLLLFSVMYAQAESSYSQETKLSINMKSTSIKDACLEIEKSTEFVFIFSDNAKNAITKKVNISANQKDIYQVLDDMLNGTNLNFKIFDKQIVVFRDDNKLISSKEEAVMNILQQQKRTISGRITDESGEAIIGANIIEANTTNGIVTDIDGNFSLQVEENATIHISYIGYLPQDINTTGRSTFNIILFEDNKALEELVVIGYGSMKKKDITTAVSVVSTSDIDNRPIVSAAEALQGKAAGIQVVQPSGAPGSGMSIRVRGATSVQASNEPLYIVDGVSMDDISSLNPNDIESMQVLKDASSAAIYGARAANGVVLITTKRGQTGIPRVKLSAYTGVSKLGKKIDALNTEEYKELMKDLKKVSNVAPTIPDDEHRYVDWNDLFFGTSTNQNYQISLSNGFDKLKYYISGGFIDEQGIVKKAHYNRYNFLTNIDSQQTDWMNLALNIAYSHSNGQWVNENGSSMRSGSILSVINTPPFLQEWNPENPLQYDENAYGSRILNPLAANAADNITATDNLRGSLGITFDITKELKFKSNFGINLSNEHWTYYLDPSTTTDGRSSKGRADESYSRNFEWVLENILTYDKSINNHNLSLMGGSILQHAQYNGSWLGGFDLTTSYPNIHSISSANQIDKDAVGSSASAWGLASFLGRAAYNYNSRYLLTANFRADGSSRFAPKHRWGYFPSLSAGWRISEEDFLKRYDDVISDMKIRIGYGINGNQGGIGNYSYLASMSVSRVAPTTDNPYPGLAISPYSAANKELTWEKTTQWNAGIDLALYNSRFIVALDAYYKKTSDLLLTVSLPANVNLPGGITRNDGEMINKGLELLLTSHNLTGKFKWDTDFNISKNINKLTKLGLNKVYYYAEMYETKENAVILKEGLPLGTFFGYISEGVDPETGNIIYTDINQNGETDPGDRTIIGNAQPDFIYGLTNSFSYGDFGLSIFFQGSQGNDIFNASRIDTEGMNDFRNQSKVVLNRWKRPGMITDIPRVGNSENLHNSTRFIEDGSYLRLKSVTLTYDLKKRWLQKSHLSKVQLYVTGQNLFTLTRYMGYDPEVNAYGGNAVVQGIDYGTYPQSKSVICGLNIEF